MAEEYKEEEQKKQEDEQQDKESTETDTSAEDDKTESGKVDDEQEDKEGDEKNQKDEQDKTDDETDDNKKVPYERFKEVNDKYKAVKKELDELKGNQSNETDESFNDANNNDTNNTGELEQYKTAFNDVFQSKLEAVPEEYKDLIPEGDDLSKFKWIESAIEKGLFDTKKAESFGNQGNNPSEEEEQSNTSFIKGLGRRF